MAKETHLELHGSDVRVRDSVDSAEQCFILAHLRAGPPVFLLKVAQDAVDHVPSCSGLV